jgi:hypothetical protein
MGLDINNDTNVDNNVGIDAQTGDNTSDKNTGDGDVMSGDTTVDLTANTTGGVIGNGSGDLGFGDFTIDSIDGINQNLNGDQGVHVNVNGTDLL